MKDHKTYGYAGYLINRLKELKWSISVARHISQSHLAEIDKPVSQAVLIPDIEFSSWVSSD